MVSLMKACRNPKCFYHVDVVVAPEKHNDRTVMVARCTEGLKNRVKFMPSMYGFCPTCSEAVAIAIKEDLVQK